MGWRGNRSADVALRLGGALLLALTGLIARTLFGGPHPHAPDVPLYYLLGAIGFGCFSAGSGLLVWGGRLFEQIDVPGRRG